jgi:hypothetical protein
VRLSKDCSAVGAREWDEEVGGWPGLRKKGKSLAKTRRKRMGVDGVSGGSKNLLVGIPPGEVPRFGQASLLQLTATIL